MLEVILAWPDDVSEQILMFFPRMCQFPRRILACESVDAAHHLIQLFLRVILFDWLSGHNLGKHRGILLINGHWSNKFPRHLRPDRSIIRTLAALRSRT